MPAGVVLVHAGLLLLVTRDGTVTIPALDQLVDGVGPTIASALPPGAASAVVDAAAREWFSIVLLEVAIATVIAASQVGTRPRARTVAAFLAGLGLLASVVGAGLRADTPLWQVVAATGGVASLSAYGLHRYERLRLGLVDGGGQRE